MGEIGEISLTGMRIFPHKPSQARWPGCRDESCFEKLPNVVKTMPQLFCGISKLHNCPGVLLLALILKCGEFSDYRDYRVQ